MKKIVLKNYSTCCSAEKLFMCCCQNAIIMFMEEQKLAPSLCHEHHDCEGELHMLFVQELIGAFVVHGQRIHDINLQKRGRGIRRY